MKYAWIENGSVRNVFVTWVPGVEDINQYFHPDVAKLYRPCPDDVQANWLYDEATDTYSAPVYPDPEPEPEPEPGDGDGGDSGAGQTVEPA
ncbi:hypothetical protein [Agrobacterium tumefaciens]|uniref:hypothetical protein n=1 Tax=Agrobacterium tumefaciens TaxID=358 RepID=UPI001571C19A|nr:hypothetical protein [Agrobacterium tumefaciens]